MRKLTGLWATWNLQDLSVTIGAVCLGAVVPFAVIVIRPTNKRLLDSALDPRGPHAAALLVRWGRFHAIRSVLSELAFGLLVVWLTAR